MDCQINTNQIKLFCQTSQLIPKSNSFQQVVTNQSLEMITTKSILTIKQNMDLKKKSNSYANHKRNSINDRILSNYKAFIEKDESKLISVPIKQYSNKFLRQKRKQEQESSQQKPDNFPNNRLQNNRKLISQFKKYKYRNKNNKKSINKQNDECVIYNLLFERQPLSKQFNSNVKTGKFNSNKTQSNLRKAKTIFGAFTQNSLIQNKNQQHSYFQKTWLIKKNDQMLKTKQEFYEIVCQKQKQKCVLSQYKKKCKTLSQKQMLEEPIQINKKFQRISTSRALQKYSKIIKINPEQGKVQKMKIKKELAKSLRLQKGERSQIQTKQITLAKKQIRRHFNRNTFITKKRQSVKTQVPTNPYFLKQNYAQQLTHQNSQTLVFTPKMNNSNLDERKSQCIQPEAHLSTSIIKKKRTRKYSHQTEQSRFNNRKIQQSLVDKFGDFQINGWEDTF